MGVEKSIVMISNLAGKMGRGQSVCETLIQLLTAHGWQVYAASPKTNRIKRLIDMAYTVFKNRKNYRVAYIEVYSGLGFIWAEIVAALLRILNKKYVLALYGGNLPQFAQERTTRVKRLLLSASAVISPSAYTKELMTPYRSDIRVLPYGVDHSIFHNRLRKFPQVKLITIRAFHRIYNLPLAARVLALLTSDFPDSELVMTGGDKHDGSWEAVQQTALEHRVQNKIKILGFVPREQLPGLLNQADIILNTPDVDNTPVSLLEAMACGLCIVSTNVGGIPYLLEDGLDALLVPPDDPGAMAAAVRRILTEPGLAERLSANARRKAEQFDWSVFLPQWEALFQEIAGTANL